MRLRFRPVDTTFYDLFAQSAEHLVEGASLLAEMLGEDNDREVIAKRMRDAEHQADETTFGWPHLESSPTSMGPTGPSSASLSERKGRG